MPTTRPRHAITETDDIVAALETARATWPQLADRPAELLRRLILAGDHALADSNSRRLDAITATSGTLTDTFPPGSLAELRDDWPE